MYTDDAVCCPFDYLSMRNPISIRTVCVYLCGSLKETKQKTERNTGEKILHLVITHQNARIDVESRHFYVEGFVKLSTFSSSSSPIHFGSYTGKLI